MLEQVGLQRLVMTVRIMENQDTVMQVVTGKWFSLLFVEPPLGLLHQLFLQHPRIFVRSEALTPSIVQVHETLKILHGHVRIPQVLNHVLQIILHLLNVEITLKKELSHVMVLMVYLLVRCVRIHVL